MSQLKSEVTPDGASSDPEKTGDGLEKLARSAVFVEAITLPESTPTVKGSVI